MIGFYNYSVIVTYIGVALSVSLPAPVSLSLPFYVWHLPAPVTLLMEKSHVL